MAKDREEIFGAMLKDLNAANFDENSLIAAGMYGEKTFVHIMADDEDLVLLLTSVFASVCIESEHDPYELALLCAAFTSKAKTDRFIERGKLNHDTIRN